MSESGESVEDFISEFHAFELENRLFELLDERDCRWWDLVRYRVQFSLCVEKGIYGRSKRVERSIPEVARKATRYVGRGLSDFITILRLENEDVERLIVSGRRIPLVNDILSEEEGNKRKAVILSNNSDFPSSHILISKQTIDLFVRIVSRTRRLDKDMKRDIRRVALEIGRYFSSDVDFYSLISRKYREHLASHRIWSFILGHINSLKIISYVNDDSLKSLVFLAHDKGLFAEEIQHGYMGRSHVAYSYPVLGVKLNTLPDSVLIDRDTDDIVYPVSKVCLDRVVLADPHIDRDIDVLVGGSPTLWRETAEIIDCLYGLDLRVALKLHPAQSEEQLFFLREYPRNSIEVYRGDLEFSTIARRARLFIPGNPTSTTTFEAVEQGVKLVIVDFDGLKKTKMNDHLVTARVNSLEDLPEIVLSQIDRDVTSLSR